MKHYILYLKRKIKSKHYGHIICFHNIYMQIDTQVTKL